VPLVRRGGYTFIRWVGDHDPPHVHVFRDGKLVTKWNLADWKPMDGGAVPRRVRKLLDELREQKVL
jgi:hypothetical protein